MKKLFIAYLILIATVAFAADAPLQVSQARYFPIYGSTAGLTWIPTALLDGASYAAITGKVSVADNGNGKYTVTFTPTVAGDYDITFTSGADSSEWLESVVTYSQSAIYADTAKDSTVFKTTGYTVPPTVGQIDTQLSDAHGASSWGGAAAGTGDTAVNQDFGGTNALQATYAGVARGGIVIKAFLTSDYSAGNTTDSYVKARTTSLDNGSFAQNLMLSHGLDYTLLFIYNGVSVSTAVAP